MKIGFIGAGKMARALARGINEAAPENQLLISDPSEESRQQFLETLPGAQIQDSNQQLMLDADVVVLAIKPQVACAALAGASGLEGSPSLTISVMAGIRLERLAMWLGHKRVIRVMPNTPCLIGQGALGMSASESVSPDDVALAESLMSPVGKVLKLDEKYLDAVTGLSGSGPAYVYTFVEALIDGGVAVGLPRDVARQLAVETVIGSAEMIRTLDLHPAVLRDQVTSPGGTTIAGLEALEHGSFRATLFAAVRAATVRSQELGG